MPIGYLLTIALVTWCTFFALLPIREGRTAGLVSWLFGFLLNELPFVAVFWLAASTLLAAVQGDLASPIGLTAFGLAILTTGGLAVIVWRARQTRPAVEQRWPWLSALDGGPGSTLVWSGGCAAGFRSPASPSGRSSSAAVMFGVSRLGRTEHRGRAPGSLRAGADRGRLDRCPPMAKTFEPIKPRA